MENKITRTENKQVAKTDATEKTNYQLQATLLKQLEDGTNEMGQSFSPYGKQCVINAIAAFLLVCKGKEIPFNEIDGTSLKLALQNIGYTELNCAAIPSECYFDFRKGTVDGKTSYSITIKPQGAGNEKLVRKYGVGLAPDGLLPAWIVREGDEFTYPTYDGFKLIPPKWVRKVGDDKKVILVVYPVIKANGHHEFLIATREGIKPNIIAQIRQNALYSDEFQYEYTDSKGNKRKGLDKQKRDEFYEKVNHDFEEMTVDQILNNPEWMKWVNPTYTSGGSKEAMVLRKIKNNALKNYPKEYDNSYIADAVKNMFEDKDDSIFEEPQALSKPDVHETIAKTEKEIESDEETNEVQDFVVDEVFGEAFPNPLMPENGPLPFDSADDDEEGNPY